MFCIVDARLIALGVGITVECCYWFCHCVCAVLCVYCLLCIVVCVLLMSVPCIGVFSCALRPCFKWRGSPIRPFTMVAKFHPGLLVYATLSL